MALDPNPNPDTSTEPPEPLPEGPLYYFAYGSNLSATQMRERCPRSPAVGLARLPGWTWLINERGYANIAQHESNLTDKPPSVTQASDPGVYGVLYRLHPDDEDALDQCEGVPWAYERVFLEVTTLEAGEEEEDEGRRGGALLREGRRVRVLAYVDYGRVLPARPKAEYVGRMNKGIDEAMARWKLPGKYMEEVMRPFIPRAR